MTPSPSAPTGPGLLYRRWWMAGPWERDGARGHQAQLAERAGDGYAGDEPLLRTLWALHPAAFPPGEPWVARCRRRHRGGPLPSASCTCGIYGTATLGTALRHGTNVAEQCVGIIRPSGSMFEASPGVWRVERAELVSLIDTSPLWAPERRAARTRAGHRNPGRPRAGRHPGGTRP